MREMIKMVVVLTILSSLSGGLLATIKKKTLAPIENQKLVFVKGPAIKAILNGAQNDPISDRFVLPVGETEQTFFVGIFDGKPNTIALETFGKGYGGNVGLMVGINILENKIIGAGVTSHAETPGMGARAKKDPTYIAQFKGLAIDKEIKVSQDGGQINALSGATITSRATCAAATEATEIFKKFKPQIEENLKRFSK